MDAVIKCGLSAILWPNLLHTRVETQKIYNLIIFTIINEVKFLVSVTRNEC